MTLSPIFLAPGSLVCGRAGSLEEAFAAFSIQARQEPTRVAPQAWCLPDSVAVDQRFDRKMLRSAEKQARMLMSAGGQALAGPSADPERSGLFIGIPSIDDPIPASGELPVAQSAAQLLDCLLTTTDPLGGLTLLNSTVLSHLAAALRITGPMGGYSEEADAGAQAVIEAALALTEGDADEALAGATSAKQTSGALSVPGALAGERYGEGAAFVRLRTAPFAGERRVTLAGFARGFAPTAAVRCETRIRLLRQAAAMAGIEPGAIDWFIADLPTKDELDAVAECVGRAPLPFGSAAGVWGFLGPAMPIAHLLLGMHGLATGRRWSLAAGGLELEVGAMAHVAINSAGSAGQMTTLLIAGERP